MGHRWRIDGVEAYSSKVCPGNVFETKVFAAEGFEPLLKGRGPTVKVP